MTRKWSIGATLAAAVLVALAGAVAQTRIAKQNVKREVGSGMTQLGASSAPWSGEWRLDPARSERPGGPMGGGPGGRRGGWRFGEGHGPRCEYGDHADRGDRSKGMGRRGRRLPEVVQVTESGNVIRFADSSGVAIQEIHLGATLSAPNQSDEGGPRQLTGRLQNGVLEVERKGPRGMTMTQTYSLEDGGRTLVIQMKPLKSDGTKSGSERFGRRGGFKLVYRRVA